MKIDPEAADNIKRAIERIRAVLQTIILLGQYWLHPLRNSAFIEVLIQLRYLRQRKDLARV